MTTLSNLQRKIQVALLVAGHPIDDVVRVELRVLRTGVWQRSQGAWSWGARGPIDIGSQSTMKACLGPVVISAEGGVGRQYHVDVAGMRDGAPAGASFALLDASRRLVWYSADGTPIAADVR